ncbi:MAG: hypothetical protein IT454_23265 [Planctomycetes bacterium]|nr:hypothetical protein [Planctomycetota bacterium]
MSAEDLELNCGVRNALNRHWIDLTKTNFFARRGHIHMSGEVSVVGPKRPPEDTANALKAFESDVRRMRDVRSMSFEFTNWIRDDSGAWHCMDKRLCSTNPPPTQVEGADHDASSSPD